MPRHGSMPVPDAEAPPMHAALLLALALAPQPCPTFAAAAGPRPAGAQDAGTERGEPRPAEPPGEAPSAADQDAAQATPPAPEEAASEPLRVDEVRVAARVLGLAFTDEELELMLADVQDNHDGYGRLQALSLANSVVPATIFAPDPAALRAAAGPRAALDWVPVPCERPADLEELAFASIAELAHLVRSRQVTCVELAELFLARLERLDERLHCVITLTPERALERARRLDAELAEGRWRGPLHGIPYGAKDLLAVAGYPTTWGARPYREQTIEADAAVVERLDEAGAVLVAKLSLGALAWGDVWFGGRTRNPWRPEQGSSGSSAGSAAATAAGAVPFAIGSETLGSIVSPSDRCGNTSLRPTFGLVSRHGAMTLSWTMDKLGPLCRSAQDAAIVFDAIRGVDPRDPTTVASEFEPPRHDALVEGWKVGFLPDEAESSAAYERTLGELEALGVELVPVELPDFPVAEMRLVLNVEAATAFDELTRSGRDDELVRQVRFAWPNAFRQARLVPAVEYVRANRLRTLLIAAMSEALAPVDALVHPSFAGDVLTATNLTGHPTLVAPSGFREGAGTPYSVSFTGGLFQETKLVALAHAWQRATTYHLEHPEL